MVALFLPVIPPLRSCPQESEKDFSELLKKMLDKFFEEWYRIKKF